MSSAKDVADELRPKARQLRDAIPGVWAAYTQLGRAAMEPGALDAKNKELIALAVAVTRQCDGCIVSHARGAWRTRATPSEVAEAIGVAIMLNGGPGTVYGPRAYAAYCEVAGEQSPDG